MMLSGSKDEIIPPRHMQELWAAGEEEGKGAPGSPATSGDMDTEGSEQKGKLRWTRIHLDVLAKLGLRTHRREESVKSTPSEAPAELETPKVSMEKRRSTEKVQVKTLEARKRKGRFVSIKNGTHSE